MFEKENIIFDKFTPKRESDLIELSKFLEQKGFDTFVSSIIEGGYPNDAHISFGQPNARYFTEYVKIGDILLISHENKMLRIIRQHS